MDGFRLISDTERMNYTCECGLGFVPVNNGTMAYEYTQEGSLQGERHVVPLRDATCVEDPCVRTPCDPFDTSTNGGVPGEVLCEANWP